MPSVRSQLLLWLWWVLANAIGFPLAVAAASGVAYLAASGAFLLLIVSVPVGSGVIGAMQWLVLRSRGVRAWWVLATTVGFAVDAAIELSIAGTEVGPIRATLSNLAGWMVLSVLQWLVLRMVVAKAGYWIIANAAAFTVAGFAASSLFWRINHIVFGEPPTEALTAIFWLPVASIIEVGLTQALAAIATGGVLVWLFSLSRPNEKPDSAA